MFCNSIQKYWAEIVIMLTCVAETMLFTYLYIITDTHGWYALSSKLASTSPHITITLLIPLVYTLWGIGIREVFINNKVSNRIAAGCMILFVLSKLVLIFSLTAVKEMWALLYMVLGMVMSELWCNSSHNKIALACVSLAWVGRVSLESSIFLFTPS